MSTVLNMRILIDNLGQSGYATEHGFALWLEADGRRILFDCGCSTRVLAANAAAAGLELSKIGELIISHGHYDHTGGLPLLLEESPELAVYAHPGIRQQRYSIRDGVAKPISMPEASSTALECLPKENLHWVTEPFHLSENLLLSGPIPRLTSYEDTGGPFFLDTAGLHADPLADEIILLARVKDGLVVITGCSHSGIINILQWVRQYFPDELIIAVIGGFHLVNASEERMRKTIEAFRELPVELLIPCHCTGENAMKQLVEELPGKVCCGAAGMNWRF